MLEPVQKIALASSLIFVSLGLTGCGGGGSVEDTKKVLSNTYVQNAFVSNNAANYQPTLATEPKMIDAGGIAIRPAGQPGHFWVLSGTKSYEYVGDVNGKIVTPCTSSMLVA